MIRSRHSLTLLLLGAATLLAAMPARAMFEDAFVRLDPASEQAIARAQKWIASKQSSTGSWGDSVRYNAGINAYAILALMVNGSTPGEGPYGKEVALGVEFLVSAQQKNGLIAGKSNGGAMYQHALATLALAECHGMTQSPSLRSALIKAVDLIVEVQGDTGGWRYKPEKAEGDISITVMQVMALRAASDVGVYVPQSTVDRAIRFIRECLAKNNQGFRYMRYGGSAEFPRSAAGLVCLQSVGQHDDAAIPSVVEYLMRNYGDTKMKHYWYGQYYASVGLYHYGGPAWKAYYPEICAKIQRDWEQKGHYHDLIDTSWAVLVLGVPYRYLPIYQR